MITEWENIGAPAVQSLEETLKEMKDYETYLSALIKEDKRFGHDFSTHSKSLTELRHTIKETENQLHALRDNLPAHVKGKGGEVTPGRAQPDNMDSAGRYVDSIFKNLVNLEHKLTHHKKENVESQSFQLMGDPEGEHKERIAILSMLEDKLKSVIASIGNKTGEKAESGKGVSNLQLLDDLFVLAHILDNLDKDKSHLEILISVGKSGKKERDKFLDAELENLQPHFSEFSEAREMASTLNSSIKKQVPTLEMASKITAELAAIKEIQGKTDANLKEDLTTLDALVESVAENEKILKANIQALKARVAALGS